MKNCISSRRYMSIGLALFMRIMGGVYSQETYPHLTFRHPPKKSKIVFPPPSVIRCSHPWRRLGCRKGLFRLWRTLCLMRYWSVGMRDANWTLGATRSVLGRPVNSPGRIWWLVIRRGWGVAKRRRCLCSPNLVPVWRLLRSQLRSWRGGWI